MTAAAVRAQELHRQHAEQTEPDHGDALAEGRLEQADAVQRDGAEHGEARRLVVDAVGNARRQRRRHADDLGVRPVGDDAIADREAVDAARRPRPRGRRCSSRAATAHRGG